MQTIVPGRPEKRVVLACGRRGLVGLLVKVRRIAWLSDRSIFWAQISWGS